MKKIRTGIVGLGRLGRRHAENAAFRIPQIDLKAVCSVIPEEIDSFRSQWESAEGYDDFETMIRESELDAVIIASTSGAHCQQIDLALSAGLHVFCEKPLGINLTECRMAEKAVEAHPNQIFMLGFMRRFDPSYQYAKKKLDSGAIGKPIMFRGVSIDPEWTIDSAIRFAPTSGGLFLDMAVHDIDLARWLLKGEAKTVYAIGGSYLHPEFAEYNDGDNVSALMQFDNQTMAFFMSGRTAPHGYHIETEVIGTEGTLRIGSVPRANQVEILDGYGVRQECSQHFLERFEAAYLNELQTFANCILTGMKPDVSVSDGTNTTVTAEAALESFKNGRMIEIDWNR
jgi:myo-inositol 2-dehydrogenase / D-chiro-inositol 1-dehydrogenase